MRRRSPIETKINHERWLVSYADFITLLFAFFVVMYSVSQVSESKYKVLSDTLQAAFSQQSPKPQSNPSIDETESSESSLATLDTLEKELTELLQGAIRKGSLSVWGNEDWVEIEVSSSLLFNSGEAEPSAEARQIFSDVAGVLSPFENSVAVSGHTDNIPIRNSRYDSNWALSSARAVAVVNLLAFEGVNPTRLSAVGFGEYQPVADNSTAEGRNENRRVVLRVARSKADAPREGAERVMDEAGEMAAADETLPSDALEPSSNLVPDNNLPVAVPEPTVNELQENTVEPIQLPNGGLLFTSDPKGRG